MRHLTDIKIHQAAVHVVAPRRGELLRSSTQIELDEGVQSFLSAHVKKGLVDGNAIAANFRVTGTDRAEGVCRSIIKSAKSFVPRSGALAKMLFDASRSAGQVDARVSDGTLVVARCSASNAGATTRFVALLKLDPSDAYRAEESEVDGRPVIRLVVQPNTLPSPRERLQKGAFIQAVGSDFDALAVDHQRRGTVVSDFFLDGFLGLEAASDDVERTRNFYRTMQRTFDDTKHQLSTTEYTTLDTFLRGAISGGSVDVDAITEALPAPPAVKEEFTAVLDSLPDRHFDTDEATVVALLQRRTFRGDHGLRVSARSPHFDDMVDVRTPADGSDDYIITIRTKEWSER